MVTFRSTTITIIAAFFIEMFSLYETIAKLKSVVGVILAIYLCEKIILSLPSAFVLCCCFADVMSLPIRSLRPNTNWLC